MEIRKLVSFGNSSFVVSLPKSWVVKNGLKKGDVVRIDERPYELVISTREEGKKGVNETTITTDGKALDELKTEIMAAYVKNYNVINISGSNIKNISGVVKPIIHNLVGMEIIEESTSSLTVKDLLDISEVSIESSLRRMDILLKSMMEDSLNPDNVESIYERDREVNRLALLSLRVFRASMQNPGMLRMFNTSYWDLFISRQVTVQMEHIGDYVKRIARLLSSEKKNDDLKKPYQQIILSYREAMKIYYKKDKLASYKLEAATKKFILSCDQIIEKKRDITTARIIENIKHMAKSTMYILRNVMEND